MARPERLKPADRIRHGDDAHGLTNWGDTFNVVYDQVIRARDASSETRAGECGLAIVAIATWLEATVNQRVLNDLSRDMKEVASEIREAAKRMRLIPRLSGWVSKEKCEIFEKDPIHETIREIFEMRNKFVHGLVTKWDPGRATAERVVKMWNSVLDYWLLLVRLGGFSRIPSSRIADFESEVRKYRI
jgi:uncharacterized protein YeeX (DUF496 family)